MWATIQLITLGLLVAISAAILRTSGERQRDHNPLPRQEHRRSTLVPLEISRRVDSAASEDEDFDDVTTDGGTESTNSH